MDAQQGQQELGSRPCIGLNIEERGGDMEILKDKNRAAADGMEKQDDRLEEIITEAPSDSLIRAAKILHVLKTKGPTNLSDLVGIVENVKEPSTIAEVRRVCHVLQAVGLLKVVRADSRRKGYGGRPQSRKGPIDGSVLGDSDNCAPSLSEMILALAAIETYLMANRKDDPNLHEMRYWPGMEKRFQQDGSRQSRAFDGHESTGEGVEQLIGQATEEAPNQKCTYEISSVGYNHLRPSPRVRLAPQMSGLSDEEAVGRCGSAGPSDQSLSSNSDDGKEDTSLLGLVEGRTNTGRNQTQDWVLKGHIRHIKRKNSDGDDRAKKLCAISRYEASTTPLSHGARPSRQCGPRVKALSAQSDGQHLPFTEGDDDASFVLSAYDWIWHLAESLPEKSDFLSALNNDRGADDVVPPENEVKCGALVMRLEDEHDRVLRRPHTVLTDVRWSLKDLEEKKRQEDELLKELVRRFGVTLPQDLQWETPVFEKEESVSGLEKLEKLVKTPKVKKVEVVREKKLSQEEARAILHRRLDSVTGEQLSVKSRVRRNVRQRLRTQSSGDGEGRILASLSCQGMTGEGPTWRDALQLSGFKGFTESCVNNETLGRSNSLKLELQKFDDKGAQQDGSYCNVIKDDLLDVRGEGIPWYCIAKQFQAVGAGNFEEKDSEEHSKSRILAPAYREANLCAEPDLEESSEDEDIADEVVLKRHERKLQEIWARYSEVRKMVAGAP